MKQIALSLIVIALGASVSADEIQLAGSTTIQPVAEQAGKAFAATHPEVTIVVGGGGSTEGVKGAAGGTISIGMASRDLKAEEKTQFPDLVVTKIATDGVALLAHKTNTVTALTKEQVQKIYTGAITNWKELGGPDRPIALISKTEGHSTLELFLHYFGLETSVQEKDGDRVGVFKMKGAAEFGTATAKLIGPNADAIAAIGENPDAIAYVSIGTARAAAEGGAKLRLLTLDGVEATVDNVASETYPLRRPLVLLTKGEPAGIVKEFIDFILSPEGQTIVQANDFIPVVREN